MVVSGSIVLGMSVVTNKPFLDMIYCLNPLILPSTAENCSKRVKMEFSTSFDGHIEEKEWLFWECCHRIDCTCFI